MSIFWFPEPESASNLLIEFGYLKRPGITEMGGGREIIEVPIPFKKNIEVKVKLKIKKKKKRKISIYARLINK